MLPLLVVVTALLLGLSRASWDGKPQQSPQIVAVSDPEPYRPPDTPANQTLYPGDGQGPCQIALRQAMDIAQSCLYNGSRQNEDVAQFCSGPDGCRQSLLDPIANVATSCRADPGSYWNVLALFDQVAFVTGSRCPTTEASCDQQARLVLNMMRLKMDTTGARAYQCSDCVKKALGRMKVTDPDQGLDLLEARSQCTKDRGQYCPAPTLDRADQLCLPCTQRHLARMVVQGQPFVVRNSSGGGPHTDGPSRNGLNAVLGQPSGSPNPDRIGLIAVLGAPRDGLRPEAMIKACYDDGEGKTCYEKVTGILRDDFHVLVGNTMAFESMGDLDLCRQPNACGNQDCINKFNALIDKAGCCAASLPMLFGRQNFDFPCADDLVQARTSVNDSCWKAFSYTVEVTVRTRDAVATVCQNVLADLAVNLAMLPNQLKCQEAQKQPDPEARTVLVYVARTPAIGMPSSIPFDPEQVQYPVVSVYTSAAA